MNHVTSTEELIHAVQKLWSNSFRGLLATHSVKYPGYPFGSLLPICRDAKGNPLLLISHLAQHTQNLQADPLCSLTLTEPGNGDVQQLARLTCLAQAEPVCSISTAERYFRYYPHTRRFHKELNFHFYRLITKQFYFIGGFGSARWFDTSRIHTPVPFSTPDEAEVLYQLNAHDHDLLNRFADSYGIAERSSIDAIGVDPFGLDIRQGSNLHRINFNIPFNRKCDLLAHLSSVSSDAPKAQ
ncbi:MAG: pyridoxamine 5'-phosphate oxidase family protein [Candidatus Thiodiazotropha sp. (ex Epidulcina cf. delphinae)]|nr:pyridoxamine 5'-phosphate oxidase family protein [Candidatus Thiodiazotropha sp. (ex Epidulcina cf. delphinae)]